MIVAYAVLVSGVFLLVFSVVPLMVLFTNQGRGELSSKVRARIGLSYAAFVTALFLATGWIARLLNTESSPSVNGFFVLAAIFALISLGCLCLTFSLAASKSANLYWRRAATTAKLLFWLNSALSLVLICVAVVQRLSS